MAYFIHFLTWKTRKTAKIVKITANLLYGTTTLEPEKATEGNEQTNEESETMTKSKKMNANYKEHESKH